MSSNGICESNVDTRSGANRDLLERAYFQRSNRKHTRPVAGQNRFARSAAENVRYGVCYGRWVIAPMCARRPTTAISGPRNSRCSGQACTGHDRGHSVVGTRRLHSELGAENCEDCRTTRRTWFPRRKAVIGRQNILPHLSALSLHSSAAVTTKLYF